MSLGNLNAKLVIYFFTKEIEEKVNEFLKRIYHTDPDDIGYICCNCGKEAYFKLDLKHKICEECKNG